MPLIEDKPFARSLNVETGYRYSSYDLAICANAWCYDDRHRFVPERAQALIAAYTDIRPFEREEEASFPLLLRGAALRFLLTRTFDTLNPDAGAVITLKDPLEYVKKLTFFQHYPA